MVERLLLPIIECPPFLPPGYLEGGEEREIAEEERRYAKYVGAVLRSKGIRNSYEEEETDEGMMMGGEEEEGEEGWEEGGGGDGGNSPQKKKTKRGTYETVIEKRIADAEARAKEDLMASFAEELRPPPPRKTPGKEQSSLDKSVGVNNNSVSMIDDASMDM